MNYFFHLKKNFLQNFLRMRFNLIMQHFQQQIWLQVVY